MADILLRGLDESVKQQLIETAYQLRYPSLNAYLVASLTQLAETNGLLPYEVEVRKRHEIFVKAIEENTKVLLQVLERIE